MGKIVAGFTVPHVPLLVANPQAANEQQRSACWSGFDQVISRVRELEVDTVIIIGDDHYTLFGPHCIPSALIAIGDVDGPVEGWLNAGRQPMLNNEPLAQHIMRYGHNNGVDWAVAKSLTVDHAIFVPWYYAVKPIAGLKAIPIYLSTGVAPFIQNRRCLEVGQSIAAAVASWEGPDRVAIFGTGGGAHWPGEAKWEDLDPDWDCAVMAKLAAGDVEALIAMSDEQILREGGNGGLEIKNWICMAGALGECTGEILAYEPVYEWLGSCSFIEMKQGRLTERTPARGLARSGTRAL